MNCHLWTQSTYAGVRGSREPVSESPSTGHPAYSAEGQGDEEKRRCRSRGAVTR